MQRSAPYCNDTGQHVPSWWLNLQSTLYDHRRAVLHAKGSVITIITKLGCIKAFTPCVPLILTHVHKQAMKTIPIGSSWHYSVMQGLLITTGDETWIHNFEAGPTRHHIMSPGTNQFNVMNCHKNHGQFSAMWRLDCMCISHILGPQQI